MNCGSTDSNLPEYENLEEYISQILPDTDIPFWFEKVQYGYSNNPEKNEEKWLNGTRNRILDWLCNEFELHEVFNKVGIFRIHQLADLIIEKWTRPISLEDKRQILFTLTNYRIEISENNFNKLIKLNETKEEESNEYLITETIEYNTYIAFDKKLQKLEKLVENLSKYNVNLDDERFIFYTSLTQLFYFNTSEADNAIINEIKKDPELLFDFWPSGYLVQIEKIKELKLERLVLNNIDYYTRYIKYLVRDNDFNDTDLLEEVLKSDNIEFKKISMYAISYGKFGKIRRFLLSEQLNEIDLEIKRSVKRILLSEIWEDSPIAMTRIFRKFTYINSHNLIKPEFNASGYEKGKIDADLLCNVLGFQPQFKRELRKLYNLSDTLFTSPIVMNKDVCIEFCNIYLDHEIISLDERAKEYINYFIKLLLTEEQEDLLFNLICLEDILFSDSKYYFDLSDFLHNLLNNKSTLVKSYSQYLIICLETDFIKLEELIENHPVDIQALWYGFSHRSDFDEDHLQILHNSIENCSQGKLLDFISKILPISSIDSSLILKLVEKILDVGKEIIYHEVHINLTFLDVRYRYLLHHLVKLCRIENISVDELCKDAEWINALKDRISIRYNKNEIGMNKTKDIVMKHLNHNNKQIQLIMSDIAIERGYEKYHQLIESLDDPTDYDCIFTLNHLDKIEKRNILNFLEVVWKRVKEDTKSNTNMVLLNLLVEKISIKDDYKTLPILSDIMKLLNIGGSLENAPIWSFYPNIDQKIWEKFEELNVINESEFEEFRDWLLTLKKDVIKNLPFYRLGKLKMFELFEWIQEYEVEEESESITTLYGILFHSIFDKRYVSYTKIWQIIDEEKREAED